MLYILKNLKVKVFSTTVFGMNGLSENGWFLALKIRKAQCRMEMSLRLAFRPGEEKED